MDGGTARRRHVVEPDDTATAWGSGDVPALATPCLLAWVEAATVAAAQPVLESAETSVGTEVRISHRRPSPVGAVVEVSVRLEARDGARLLFGVRAVDDAGRVLVDGEVERAVVHRARFVERLAGSRR